MDYLQAAQDGRTVPSEAAGHSVADNWEVQTVSKGQFSFRRNQLLECLQEAEKSHQRVWHKQANQLSLLPSFVRRHTNLFGHRYLYSIENAYSQKCFYHTDLC